MQAVATALFLGAMLLGVTSAAAYAADDDQVRATRHYETGTRLYEIGEYRKALAEFRAAYVAKPDPSFVYNSAQCHRQLGERREALILYQRYLSLAPKSAHRPQVEKHIRELEAADAAAVPSDPPRASPVPDVPLFAAVPDTPAVVSRDVTPLHRRSWLWAGIGAVAAVVLTAVVLSTSGGSSDPRCPSDVERCGP
jgi:tetratricopeptide (TPR) repeat protein